MQVQGEVWLTGNPPFTVTYEYLNEKPIPTDITAYRPDPRNYLSENKKYTALLIFDSENTFNGISTIILRRIKIDGKIFAKIR